MTTKLNRKTITGCLKLWSAVLLYNIDAQTKCTQTHSQHSRSGVIFENLNTRTP